MHPVDYVYDDTQAHTMSLYGRGFGYSRVLPGALRSLSELGEPMDLGTFDALVIGSVSRNVKLAKDLRAHFPAQKTIWIHGEDGSPTLDETYEMKATGVNLFVRAIHTGRR